AWGNDHTPKPAGELPKEGARTLTVTVSGAPDGKPLAHLPLLVCVDHERYAATTDDSGAARLPLPATSYRVAVVARPEGLVPGMLSWGEKETLPERAELKLSKGMPIGGVVQDEAGKPIEGARVFLIAPQNLGDHAWADLLD